MSPPRQTQALRPRHSQHPPSLHRLPLDHILSQQQIINSQKFNRIMETFLVSGNMN